MKKILSFVLLMVMVMNLGNISYANEPMLNKAEFSVSVGGLDILIPYSEKSVYLVYGEDEESCHVDVFDNNTGEHLTRFGVCKEIQPMSRNGYSIHTIYRETSFGHWAIKKAKLFTRMKIYKSGSFGQINEVLSTWWEPEDGFGIGEIIIQSSDAISTSGSFPTNEIEVDGSVVCQIACDLGTGAAIDGGISISTLIELGFGRDYSIGSTVYYTKSKRLNYKFRLIN